MSNIACCRSIQLFLISGLGFGLIYLPAIVSVGYYFEEKRAFATGLAVCGSGLGAFIFNPVSKYLIDEYGWRGAILIEAALILNCVLCGALFRPLESTKSSGDGKAEKKPLVPDSLLVKDHLELELVVSSASNVAQFSDEGHNVTSQPSSPTRALKPFLQLEQPGNTAIFRSEGALNKTDHKPITPSPLTIESSGHSKPPHLKRLLSEDPTRPHHHRQTHAHSHEHHLQALHASQRSLMLSK